MLLAWIPVALTAAGLFVHVRGLRLAEGTRAGTIARFEAERATEAGALLTMLTSPWLALTAALVG